MNRCKKFNILFITPFGPPTGGMETWSRIIKEELERDNDIGSFFYDTTLRYREQANNELFIRLLAGTSQCLVDLFKIFFILFLNKIDVIHVNTTGSLATIRDFCIIILADCFRAKCYLHYHIGRLHTTDEREPALDPLLRYVLSSSSGNLLLGKDLTIKARKKYPSGRYISVYNPSKRLPVDAIYERANRKTKILFIGKINPAKGVEVLCDACDSLGWTDIDITFVGKCSDKYRDYLIRRYPAIENRLLGEVDSSGVFSLLRVARILVLPSFFEAFPYVIVEALGFGIPVIATDVGAIKEMTRSASGLEAAILIKAGDSSELALKMKCLIEQEDTWFKMSLIAKEIFSEKFETSKVVESLKHIWLNDENRSNCTL